MDILSILQLVLGIILIFFLPGFLIIRLFYKKMAGLERIVLIPGLSIAASIFIGLILAILGIFNYWSSIVSYIILIVILFAAKYFLENFHKR